MSGCERTARTHLGAITTGSALPPTIGVMARCLQAFKSEEETMRLARGMTFGFIGAAGISVASALLRAMGIPIDLELVLGTLAGAEPSVTTFMLGLALHLGFGTLFGMLYAWLFERVWHHGGAGTGMLLGVIHAALIGIVIGLMPRFHPLIPELVPDPGPYFANGGAITVIAFFVLHVLYGAVVGAGYGRVASDVKWGATPGGGRKRAQPGAAPSG